MKRNRCLLILTAVVVSYAAVELCSFALYYYFYGVPFSFARTNAYQHGVLASLQLHNVNSSERFSIGSSTTLHPYLGFVYNPDMISPYNPDMIPPGSPLITPYGFMGEADPIAASRDPHNAIVAVTGGSVAEYLFRYSRSALHQEFEKLPMFHGKKLILIMLGRGMYQQPQQFISVAYYLMQGGRLDLLVNVDGYNEVHYGLDNHAHGIYPPYPSPEVWPYLFSSIANPDQLGAIGNMMLWKQARYIAASAFSHLRFSVTASTLWGLIDTYLYKQFAETQLAVAEETSHRPYFIVGPSTMNDATEAQTAEFIATFWEKSSQYLDQLAQLNHFYYFHFLQPNQHVPDSKPLSREEKASFYVPDSPWGKTVVTGYPFLQKHLALLRSEGVNAYDLTGIFKNTHETLYIDNCCHLNQQGNDMLAHSIGAHISDFFSNRTQSPPNARHTP